jgi:predicted PurR-regulated permease PerM
VGAEPNHLIDADDTPDEPRTSRPPGSVAIPVLATLAVFYTLYLARAFLLPLTFAILLFFFFSPLIRALGKIRIPAPFGAGLVIVALVGSLGLGMYALAEPAQVWIDAAPRTLSVASARLDVLRKRIRQLTRTTEQVERAANVGGTQRTPEVIIKGPTLSNLVFGTTQTIVASALEVLILLYFLLAAGDLFLQKLIKVLPLLSDKKRAVRIARDTERSISTYLVTSALLNTGEGIAISLVMWGLGVPNPVLWGVVVALLEFAPYLGAFAAVGVFLIVGLTAFSAAAHALAVPLSFLAVNLVWGNFVSPIVMSRRLTLNPVAILVGLSFWFFVWGIPGAFVAVPLLAVLKIICDHTDGLTSVGEFLSRGDGVVPPT